MQIFLKRTMQFIEGEIVTNDNGEKVRNVKQHITVNASDKYQEVPDWIKNTDEFKLGVDTEDIIEVEVKKKKEPDVPAPSPKPAPIPSNPFVDNSGLKA